MKIIITILSLVVLFQLSQSTSTQANTADGCEFIRQALEKLPAKGGTIDIPAGIFECRAMIVLKKNHVVMRGAGQKLTTLRLANQAHAPVLVIGDDQAVQNDIGEWVPATRVTDVEVSNLTIDGNLNNQDTSKECGNKSCDGDMTSIRNNAITIRGASYVRIKNVTAHSAISGGLVTEKYCDHLHVSDFTSYGNHFDGFAGYQTEDSLFENINLSRNRGAGISIDIDFNKNRFSNGILASNGDVGVFARDINGVIFEKLKITQSGNHGVFLAQAHNPDTCANNLEFRSVIISRSKGHGIHLASPCVGNKVTGKSILEKNALGCFYVNSGTTMAVDKSVVCKRRENYITTNEVAD